MDSELMRNPFFWVLLASVFTAAAAARLTILPVRSRHPERDRRRRWTWVSLFLSAAILSLLGAAIFPDPAEVLDRRLIYFFLGLFFVSFLGFRFRKAIGLPILLLLSILFLSVLLLLQSFTAFTGETGIGTVGVLSVSGGVMDLEVSLPEPSPDEDRFFVSLQGQYFAPVVELVMFDDILVFLGGRTLYRMVGISGFEAVREGAQVSYRQSDQGFRFPDPPGISARLYQLFERYGDRIPGVRSVQVDLDLKLARSLRTYSLRLQSDGGVQVVEERP